LRVRMDQDIDAMIGVATAARLATATKTTKTP
jgi:hypothetical protein